MQMGESFNRGFLSSFNRYEEEKERDRQIDKIKTELQPVITGLSGVSSYEQMMDKMIEHPEWMLNPRTAPVVGGMVKNWEAAEAIKTRAQNSKQAAAEIAFQQEYESAVGDITDDDLRAQWEALPDKGYYQDIYGRRRPSVNGLRVVNESQRRKGLLPVGASKGTAQIRVQEAKGKTQKEVAEIGAQGRVKVAEINVGGRKEVIEIQESGRDRRQKSDQDWKAEQAEFTRTFREKMQDDKYEHIDENRKAAAADTYKLQMALARYRSKAKGKTPLDTQIDLAKQEALDASRFAAGNPKDAKLGSAALQKELWLNKLLREKQKEMDEEGSPANETGSGGSRKPDFIFDEQTGKIVPAR